MSTFTKLDSGIIHSSIWDADYPTRIVWITILAMKDENGFVATSRSGLKRAANVSEEDLTTAIKCLESPDADSRTKDYEGRRIECVEGGWIVLNHLKYRAHSDIVKEQTRERVQRFREKNKDVTQSNVTGALPSVSVSLSESVKEKEEEMQERKERKTIPPQIEWVTAYCNERQNNVIPQKFFDYYQARGWKLKGTLMKDWQAAVRTWESSGYNNKPESKRSGPVGTPIPPLSER